MDKRTLTALRGSIEKWRRIAEGFGEDLGPHNCPLCKKFRNTNEGHWCAKCPVSEESGCGGCFRTPYVPWDDFCEMVGSRRAKSEEAKLLALDEYVYLLSLLPEGVYE